MIKMNVTAFLFALLWVVPLTTNAQKSDKNTTKVKTGPYKDKSVSEVKDAEFAEVMNIADLISKVNNETYLCRVFSCNNGPGISEPESGNSSTNYYISNGKTGLPSGFKLFKVGPFYKVVNSTFVPGIAPETYILTIQHIKGSKRFITKYVVSYTKVIGWNG